MTIIHFLAIVQALLVLVNAGLMLTAPERGPDDPVFERRMSWWARITVLQVVLAVGILLKPLILP